MQLPIVTFPGIQSLLEAQYTLSHGITPGVAHITCLPQALPIALGGTLTFTYGPVLIQFPNCKIDQGSLRLGPDGRTITLSIFDRRWKWAFGEISGSYNQRQADGTIAPSTLRTPQQLAAACLIAMGETAFDVSQIPNDTNPIVDWDRDNPAQMLANLAEQLGCRVVLKLDNSVLIARTGVGLPLPVAGNFLLDAGESVNPPERPDALKVVCGKTRWQVDFALTSVGLDLDGSIKPRSQLSYTPANGWVGETPGVFSGVAAGRARDLAKQTVYRWYQISLIGWDNNPVSLPGFADSLVNLSQILPIEDVQIEQYLDADGSLKSRPAWVYGIFLDGTKFPFVNSSPGTYYTQPFTVDKANGVVVFDSYVVKLNNAGQFDRASLSLRVACSARTAIMNTWTRYERVLAYQGGNWGTGARVLKHDEIENNIVVGFNTATGFPTGQYATNEAAVISEADYYLAAANAEYQTPNPVEATYATFLPISPDGAIQQVTWSFSESGPTTRASYNNEFSSVVTPYRERRIWEQWRGALAQRLQRMAAELNIKKE